MSTIIHSEQAPQFPLPFSQAIKAGDFVYVSGQVGVDPATREAVGDSVEEQTKQCIRNIETILRSAGLTLDHVIKVNAHLADGSLTPKYNEAYATMFNAPYPTRTTVTSGVGKYLVEIDVIAYAVNRRGE